MRENRYFPHRPLFLRQFFPGAEAPIKVHEGAKFREVNRGKENRCAPFVYNFGRAPRAPMSLVPIKLFTSRFFRVSSLFDTHQILSYSMYLHVSRVNGNDVATTNLWCVRSQIFTLLKILRRIDILQGKRAAFLLQL